MALYYKRQLNLDARYAPRGPFVLNESSPQAQGLIGWWPDASLIGGELKDYSINANHGSVNGGMANSNVIASEFGHRVPDYAGTDHAYDMGDLEIMDVMTAYTFSCRFHLNATFGSGFETMMGKWNDVSADRSWVLAIGPTGGSNDAFICFIKDAGGTTRNAKSGISDQAAMVGKVVLGTSTWGAVEDVGRVYVNGAEEAGSTTFTGVGANIRESTRPFRIGAHTSAASGFDGYVFDVRVYDRKMSAREVWELKINPWDLWYETGKVSFFFPPVGAISDFRFRMRYFG